MRITAIQLLEMVRGSSLHWILGLKKQHSHNGNMCSTLPLFVPDFLNSLIGMILFIEKLSFCDLSSESFVPIFKAVHEASIERDTSF